jgi:hypothetical protein
MASRRPPLPLQDPHGAAIQGQRYWHLLDHQRPVSTEDPTSKPTTTDALSPRTETPRNHDTYGRSRPVRERRLEVETARPATSGLVCRRADSRYVDWRGQAGSPRTPRNARWNSISSMATQRPRPQRAQAQERLVRTAVGPTPQPPAKPCGTGSASTKLRQSRTHGRHRGHHARGLSAHAVAHRGVHHAHRSTSAARDVRSGKGTNGGQSQCSSELQSPLSRRVRIPRCRNSRSTTQETFHSFNATGSRLHGCLDKSL